MGQEDQDPEFYGSPRALYFPSSLNGEGDKLPSLRITRSGDAGGTFGLLNMMFSWSLPASSAELENGKQAQFIIVRATQNAAKNQPTATFSATGTVVTKTLTPGVPSGTVTVINFPSSGSETVPQPTVTVANHGLSDPSRELIMDRDRHFVQDDENNSFDWRNLESVEVTGYRITQNTENGGYKVDGEQYHVAPGEFYIKEIWIRAGGFGNGCDGDHGQFR